MQGQAKLGLEEEKTFQQLKSAFTMAPILIHLYIAKPLYMKMDASDFAIGIDLSQMEGKGRLHPIAI